jgi:serine/threonine protein kinase
MPEPGELLGEHYRVREVIPGGMGEVYICDLVSDPDDTEPAGGPGQTVRVALKTFQRKFFFDNASRQAFVREATTWLRLSNLPHVMPVLSIQYIDDQPFVLMPAVPPGPRGERSLADLVRHSALDAGSAPGFASQLARALQWAASRIPGLVHGDIKPANVLLMFDSAFLADFGLVSGAALGRPDLRLEGTWAYRGPELW